MEGIGKRRTGLTTRRTDFLDDSCNSPEMTSSSNIYVREFNQKSVPLFSGKVGTNSIGFLEVEYPVMEEFNHAYG